MNAKINLLDCTLRDGGHVNNFLFRKQTINSITSKLVNAGVDIVELGFVQNVTFDADKTLYDSVSRLDNSLPRLAAHQRYSLMIRPDRFDIRSLEPSTSIGILRFAFLEEHFDLALKYASVARELSYDVFLNPVNVMGYSEESLRALLTAINDFSPTGVAIVDTFGAMNLVDLDRIHPIFEEYLSNNITLGLHLHENLSLSHALAQRFFKLSNGSRELVIDSSLNGMGRIPGNLCTEIIAEHLNKYSCRYRMDYIYSAIQEDIIPFKQDFEWGYCPAFAISAMLGVHRSYPEYLKYEKKVGLPIIYLTCNDLANSKSAQSFSKAAADEVLARYV